MTEEKKIDIKPWACPKCFSYSTRQREVKCCGTCGTSFKENVCNYCDHTWTVDKDD